MMEIETLFCPRAVLAGSRSTTQSANTAKTVDSPISHNTRNTLTRLWWCFPSSKHNEQRIKIILSNRRFSHQGTFFDISVMDIHYEMTGNTPIVIVWAVLRSTALKSVFDRSKCCPTSPNEVSNGSLWSKLCSSRVPFWINTKLHNLWDKYWQKLQQNHGLACISLCFHTLEGDNYSQCPWTFWYVEPKN